MTDNPQNRYTAIEAWNIFAAGYGRGGNGRDQKSVLVRNDHIGAALW